MLQTELFIGLVGAVGTDLQMVADEIATELDSYDYQTHVLRLSEYLPELGENPGLMDLRYDERVWEGMTEGDRLRQRWKRGDALALCAISDIVATRQQDATEVIETGKLEGSPGYLPVNLDRVAFVLRSLKTQDELETLRAVYGSRFVLIAASSSDDDRRRHLEEVIATSRRSRDAKTWVHQPDELMARDLKEEVEGGQDTRGTFHQADFFIRAADRETAREDIARVLAVLFGDPFRTPTRDEYAQFQAAGAALRSAEPGRQVGAALTDENGSVLALGSNEVPRYRGGARWEEDGPGNREFEVTDRDTNRLHQERIAEQLEQGLMREIRKALDNGDGSTGDELVPLVERLRPALGTTFMDHGLNELTEYGRAVHAEMSALLDAARRGVPVAGATLYTTTFPCHNCARHIVAAGVLRVVYVEPYAKSKAGPLHGDSIAISDPKASDKVVFEPFVGVAPRRYLAVFDAAARERQGHLARKDDRGFIQTFCMSDAVPVFGDVEPEGLQPLLPTYRQREFIALRRFETLSEQNAKPPVQPPVDGG